MPFGLTNALATFQALMNHVFRPFLRKFVLVFFWRHSHLQSRYSLSSPTLAYVFNLLAEHQLYANLRKCQLARSRVEYLGHWASSVGGWFRKIQVMGNWPVPWNLKELRGFLGLTGYYWRFWLIVELFLPPSPSNSIKMPLPEMMMRTRLFNVKKQPWLPFQSWPYQICWLYCGNRCFEHWFGGSSYVISSTYYLFRSCAIRALLTKINLRAGTYGDCSCHSTLAYLFVGSSFYCTCWPKGFEILTWATSHSSRISEVGCSFVGIWL